MNSAGRKSRSVTHASTIEAVSFSPDSRQLAAATDDRLVVYEISDDSIFDRARGGIHGYSFAPDSRSVVYAKASATTTASAASDLYRLGLGGKHPARLTHDHRSLNPLWTKQGIVFDKEVVGSDGLPHFDLFVLDGGGERTLNVPRPDIPLTVGLVPVARSTDGARDFWIRDCFIDCREAA